MAGHGVVCEEGRPLVVVAKAAVTKGVLGVSPPVPKGIFEFGIFRWT